MATDFLHGIEIVTVGDASGGGGAGSGDTPGYATPYFIVPPSISGTPKPGFTLVADKGEVGNGAIHAFGWRRDNVAVSGNLGPGDLNLTLSADDVGHVFDFYVSATGAGGSVLNASLALTVSSDDPPVGQVTALNFSKSKNSGLVAALGA